MPSKFSDLLIETEWILDMRKASIERNTKETSIAVEVNLDGEGSYNIETGIGFLDHMLEQLSRHSLIDITVRAKGDTHICLLYTSPSPRDRG